MSAIKKEITFLSYFDSGAINKLSIRMIFQNFDFCSDKVKGGLCLQLQC